MANDDIIEKLEEWKEKYYQSATDLEEQKKYDELLQRSLGRLSLATQGLDPALDRQLTSLRQVLRGENNHGDVELILNRMEIAIAEMDEKKIENTQSIGAILADLLTLLSIPKKFKSEAKSLAKKLNTTSDNDITGSIPKLLSLLDQCINADIPKSSGLFSFLGFGKKSNSNSNEPAELIQENSDITPFVELSEQAIPAPQALMELLERLALPNDLSKKATKIRHRIESGIDNSELHQVINDIAEVISQLGSQAVEEKHEYEEFLKTLTSRLHDLDQHIRQTSNEDNEAFEQRNAISRAVEDEVTGLRSHVEKATNLDKLKSSVSDRLDVLNDHFEKYRKSDHDRFHQSQSQIQALTLRLHDMEQESDELREVAEKSRELALKDALTGIWNRQALNENLEQEFSRWQRYQKPLSMVIWDIDFFKRVNDNYGHAAGDKVLKTIAQIFTKETRDCDFIARFGGEEFVGIFPETRLEDALQLANKIRDKIEHSKFHYENKPVPITASAGLARFKPSDTVEDVFKRADTALYKAKESGRNRCLSED